MNKNKLIYVFRDELVKSLYQMETQGKEVKDIIKEVYDRLTLLADKYFNN